jgi:hypothetical protein
MPTFTVGVTRLAIVYQEIEVEAPSARTAAALALTKAKDCGTAGWEVDDVYDDGKPHCEIAISTCRDDAGDEADHTGASDVFHIDTLDDEAAKAFDSTKPWVYQDDDVQLCFATEDEACAEQMKRDAVGRT